MKKSSFLITASILGVGYLNAQDIPEKPTVKITGFVRSEAIFDSYKSIDKRDGETYMYPLAKATDANGNDLNNQNQFKILSLVSRLRTVISGGTALNAKISGLVEADFAGAADASAYMLTLRHAYIKMDWAQTSLLAGQYWHPLCNAEFMANVVSFGSGTPMQPFCRTTQVRVTRQVVDNVKVMGALSAFSTHKPKEPALFNTHRMSGLPDMQLQLQYGSVKELFVLVTGGYKWLKPVLSTTVGTGATALTYESQKVIGSYDVQACLGYQLPFLSIKGEVNYIQNATPFSMIGGYSPVANSRNLRGGYDYSNINTVSAWGDLETKGEKMKFGMFFGYTENLGSKDKLTISTDYSTDANLRKVWRVSPRATYAAGPVDFGLEYVMTTAGWGTYIGSSVKNTASSTVDHRLLASIRYSF
jgi:hypothetical protein